MSSVKLPSHPYVPKDLIISHYVPSDINVVELLVTFFGSVTVVIGILWLYMRNNPYLKGDITAKLKITWFLSCGLIHIITEGYFALHHKTVVAEKNFLAEIWKEYGKGDSRYVISDTLTVCNETITAFVVGPLALWTVYAFINNKPYRYVVQVLPSLCQLYGTVLYFYTEFSDGFEHGHMWHPLYFWFYFVFMNILWIIIPFMCVLESYNCLTRAQAVTDSRLDKRV